MAIVPNAQDLQIDAACLFDQLFIFYAVFFDVFLLPFPIRDMTVLGVDVHFAEQLLFHESVVALQGVVVDGVIFIEVERDHILKAQTFFPVKSYQLCIQGFGRGACRQT